MAKEKPEKKNTPKNAAKKSDAVSKKNCAADKKTSKKASTAAKPMAVPKQKRSIETRLKILSVGGDLILQKGYHNITADDIAKAAGLSTGIVYHYFRDKKDILIQALQMTADQLMGDVTRFYHNDGNQQKSFTKVVLDDMSQHLCFGSLQLLTDILIQNGLQLFSLCSLRHRSEALNYSQYHY